MRLPFVPSGTVNGVYGVLRTFSGQKDYAMVPWLCLCPNNMTSSVTIIITAYP